MTRSSLKDRLATLGPVKDAPRSQSGSPVVLALRRKDDVAIRTVDAASLLAWGGVALTAALRSVEKVIETGELVVEVPQVPDAHAFIKDLRATGLSVTPRPRHSAEDITRKLVRLRKHLGLTQEQFALRYGLEADTLQNWEQGRREPGEWLYAYLRVIERDPEAVSRALDEEA